MLAQKARWVAVSLFLYGAISFASSAQESAGFGGDRGLSLQASYAPTSQHILIGECQARKTTQVAVVYTRKIKKWSNVELLYEGSIEPFYLESDPTNAGVSSPNPPGPPIITIFPKPVRGEVVSKYAFFEINGKYVLSENIPGPNEDTYAFAAYPLGARMMFFTRSRLEPTFAVNLGALYAARNIPFDATSSFNFLADIGPGLEFFLTKRRSVRLEYLYAHLSNADLGLQNPGVDSGTFRLTLTHYY